MLRENRNVRQEPGHRRRWFEDDGLELIVWLDGADEVEGFQLCRAGRALTWRRDVGFTIGITNHPSTGYGPALTLLERYADRYPLEDMVSHEYALADVDAAMRMSMSTESLKVAMVPSLG